jgi:hypothetical protein
MNDATWRQGKGSLKDELARFPKTLLNDPAFRRAIAEELLQIMRDEYWIKTKGSRDSANILWEPWSKAYAKQAKKQPRKGGVGLKTGRLWLSLRPQSPEALIVDMGRRLFIGSKVPYARHFNKRRPIFPERLIKWPVKWRQRLFGRMAREAQKILKKRLQGGR